MLLEKMRSAIQMRKVEDRGDAIANAIIGIALTLIMLAIGFVLFSNILPGQQVKANQAEVASVVQSAETIRAAGNGSLSLENAGGTSVSVPGLGGDVKFPDVTFYAGSTADTFCVQAGEGDAIQKASVLDGGAPVNAAGACTALPS